MRVREAVAKPDSYAMAKELAALLAFSLAVTVAAGLIRTHAGLPGHRAVIWMPILLLAGFRRPGLTAGAALAGGSLGAALGAIDAEGLAALMAAAAIVEAFGLSTAGRWRAPLFLAAGICGNLGKLALKFLLFGVVGLPLNKMRLPLLPTFAIYAAAGLAAGFIALGIVTGWEKLRREPAGPPGPTTE
ncbi:MAG: hypothetical protein FJX74_21915 [Armatimonadetes bacterium]|nr:hypothetical protein [Armatimonadota bacterium]